MLFLKTQTLNIHLSLSLSLSLLLCLLRPDTATAQNVSINTNGDPAHPTAILDVTSTDKGILVPRMTTVQRNMILNPAQGLLVYDLDTRSFWFYDGGWAEISSGGNSGPAGGDLSGNYPNPNVSKIQNLDVAVGVPNDKQVLKWDALANHWKGQNDSLFLPYQASQSLGGAALFSINNTFNGFSYNQAILGRRGAGSGFSVNFSSGVWGDSPIGTGILGTSDFGTGVYGKSTQAPGVQGYSVQHHGVAGESEAPGFAGVYGSSAAAGGTGVIGQSTSGFGVGGLSSGQDKAGVIGTNTHNGDNVYGVIGLIENATGGAAVFGKNNAPNGHAGLFTSNNAINPDPALKAVSSGIAAAGYFINESTFSEAPVIKVQHQGKGSALALQNTAEGSFPLLKLDAYGSSGSSVLINNYNASTPYTTMTLNNAGTGSGFSCNNQNPQSSFPAIHAYHVGPGKAITGSSALGTAASFLISNASNDNPVLTVENNGTGSGLHVTQLNTSASGSGIYLMKNGTGTGLEVITNKGKAGSFTILDPNYYSNVLELINGGKGAALDILNTNSANSDPMLNLTNQGTGSGIWMGLYNPASTSAGLYMSSAGQIGVKLEIAGTTGLYAKTSANSGISVHGITGSTANTAVGVKGETGNGGEGGTGVLGITPSGDSQGIGVKGISYGVGSGFGAVTGINHANGVGVYGEVTAATGYAIYGKCGQNNLDAHSAKFENVFANSTYENVNITTNGKGINLFLNNSNVSNTQPQFRMIHKGTGNFIQLESDFGAMTTSISKAGNIKTKGTLTVKDDKGIVRSSTSSQLRVEVVNAVFDAAGNYELLSQYESRILNVTFATPFSSAPAVYISNLTTVGNADLFVTTVQNVSTTGCQLVIRNIIPDETALYDSTWKLVAMGQE